MSTSSSSSSREATDTAAVVSARLQQRVTRYTLIIEAMQAANAAYDMTLANAAARRAKEAKDGAKKSIK